MNRIIVLSIFIFLSFSIHAEVYKWVDEDGVTHYGSRKHLNIKVENVNIKESSNTPKQLTGVAKKMADSFTKEIMRDKGDAKELDCKKAVLNAKDSVDTMLNVGKKNFNDGYMKQADYKKMSRKLMKIQKRISLSECQNSKGQVQGFYKCMSNDYNHIASCGKKYNYGS